MDRRTFIKLAAGGAGILALPQLFMPVQAMAAERIAKISKTDAEWKKLLTPEQYEVLRQEGTEAPFTSPLNHEKRNGMFALRCLRAAAVPLEIQVRQRHRLAELLRCAARPCRDQNRLQAGSAAHRIPLRALRRPPRPCVQRRAQAHRPEVLQQRRGFEIHRGQVTTRTQGAGTNEHGFMR